MRDAGSHFANDMETRKESSQLALMFPGFEHMIAEKGRRKEVVMNGTFLDLPSEIRCMLYRYLMKDDSHRFSPQRPYGAATLAQRALGSMISTCKTIRYELTPLFVKNYQFVVYGPKRYPDILSRYGTLSCSCLRLVEVGIRTTPEIATVAKSLLVNQFPCLESLTLSVLSKLAFFDTVAILGFKINMASHSPMLGVEIPRKHDDSAKFQESYWEEVSDLENAYSDVDSGALNTNFTIPTQLRSLIVKSLYVDNPGVLLRVDCPFDSKWTFCRDGQLWSKDGMLSVHRIKLTARADPWLPVAVV